MLDLKGLYPPLPTSFREDESLYPEMMSRNIEWLCGFDLAGILVLGSNGELVMLDEKEKETVFCAARAAIPEGKIMLAGTGGQSTIETIRLTKMAAKCGTDAVLVLNPSYYRGLMTKEALRRHYFAVADASPVPVLIYNMPANSGLDMDAETIASFSVHENIIGVKDSGGNVVKMADIIRLSSPGFQVLAGSAGFLLPALSIGAIGGILALANIAPQFCLDIYNSFREGDLDRAAILQRKAVPVNSAVTSRWGIPALKAAMDHLGRYGGAVRSPLMEISDDNRNALYKILDEIPV